MYSQPCETAPSSSAASAPAVVLPRPVISRPDLGDEFSPDEELSYDANGKA